MKNTRTLSSRIAVMGLCLVLLAGILSGCGGSASKTTGSSRDYREVIEAARPAEINEAGFYAIVTGPDDDMHSMVFDPAFGFVEDDMERYAISLGFVITKAYGVAIVLPKEGRQQAVISQFEAFVEMQKKAQENYLPDQYEIAKSAIIKTAPTGEVLLAMCENPADVMAAMLDGLKE